jgi:phage gp36-like protein
MSAYITYARILTVIPEDYVRQACDDANTGDAAAIDARFAELAEEASRSVDELLSARYTVPFADPLPAAVSGAAKVFLGEMLYQRRGAVGDSNPFFKQAEAMRTRLAKIGRGDEPLQTGAPEPDDSVAIVTEPSRLAQAGQMLF